MAGVDAAAALRLKRMGYHLWADVRHDFGPGAPVYNIGGPDAADTNPSPSGSGVEERAVNYFLSPDVYPTIANDPGNARKDNQVIFTIPEKTSTFSEWTPPSLHPTGNDKLGVIHDAGEFITLQLGSKNVITFGSILDPAPKPIAPPREPMWYDPGAVPPLRIGLEQFGFNPAVIRAVEIGSLTAGGVTVGFELPNAVKIDAISMNSAVPAAPKLKEINDFKIANAGFFTSIQQAKNLEQELRESVGKTAGEAKEIVDKYEKYFYVGKTLGDVSLVASGLALANPYPGVGEGSVPGNWKWWAGAPPSGPATPSPPDMLILKTGDRLNWIRAILFGLGSIYEDQAKGARKVKQYVFFPGVVSDTAMKTALITGFESIALDVERRYDGVIASLRDVLMAGGAIQKDRTVFVGQTNTSLNRTKGFELGKELLDVILIPRLGALKALVAKWVRDRGISARYAASPGNFDMDSEVEILTGSSLSDLRAYYEATRLRANACAPSAASIFTPESKLLTKLIIANIPPSAIPEDQDWPLKVSLDISLMNAFQKFNNAGAVPLSTVLAGTDINNRFVNRFPLGGPQTGGAKDDLGEAAIQDMVFAVTDKTERVFPDGKAVRLGNRGDFDEVETGEIYNECPRIRDFAEFFKTVKVDADFPMIIRAAAEVVNVMDSKFIVDKALAADLRYEVSALVVRGDIASVTDTPKRVTYGSVIFNAYTYEINARNACFRRDGVVEETESSADFDRIKRYFLDVLNGPNKWQSEASQRVDDMAFASAGREGWRSWLFNRLDAVQRAAAIFWANQRRITQARQTNAPPIVTYPVVKRLPFGTPTEVAAAVAADAARTAVVLAERDRVEKEAAAAAEAAARAAAHDAAREAHDARAAELAQRLRDADAAAAASAAAYAALSPGQKRGLARAEKAAADKAAGDAAAEKWAKENARREAAFLADEPQRLLREAEALQQARIEEAQRALARELEAAAFRPDVIAAAPVSCRPPGAFQRPGEDATSGCVRSVSPARQAERAAARARGSTYIADNYEGAVALNAERAAAASAPGVAQRVLDWIRPGAVKAEAPPGTVERDNYGFYIPPGGPVTLPQGVPVGEYVPPAVVRGQLPIATDPVLAGRPYRPQLGPVGVPRGPIMGEEAPVSVGKQVRSPEEVPVGESAPLVVVPPWQFVATDPVLAGRPYRPQLGPVGVPRGATVELPRAGLPVKGDYYPGAPPNRQPSGLTDPLKARAPLFFPRSGPTGEVAEQAPGAATAAAQPTQPFAPPKPPRDLVAVMRATGDQLKSAQAARAAERAAMRLAAVQAGQEAARAAPYTSWAPAYNLNLAPASSALYDPTRRGQAATVSATEEMARAAMAARPVFAEASSAAPAARQTYVSAPGLSSYPPRGVTRSEPKRPPMGQNSGEPSRSLISIGSSYPGLAGGRRSLFGGARATVQIQKPKHTRRHRKNGRKTRRQ